MNKNLRKSFLKAIKDTFLAYNMEQEVIKN